ncbi:tetratricopeptide repeat protein [bacterium]|nr:tetratricopeptide repeat protein [bacterium]
MNILYGLIIFLQTLVVNQSATEDEQFIRAYLSKTKFYSEIETPDKFIERFDKSIVDILTGKKLEAEIIDYQLTNSYIQLKYMAKYLLEIIEKNTLIKEDYNREQLCNSLLKTSPKLPYGYYCKGDYYFSKSKIAFWKYIPNYLKGALQVWNTGVLSEIAITQIIYFLSISFLIFSLIFIVYGFRLLFNDIKQIFQKKFTPINSTLLALIVITTPLILPFDSIYIFLGYVAVISSYFHKKFLISTIVIILTPYIIFILIQTHYKKHQPLSQIDQIAYESVFYDYPLSDSETKMLKENNSLLSQVAIAKKLKNSGDFEGTLSTYEKILQTHKMDFIYNNMANLLFYLKKEKEALENYKAAITLNPKNSLYYYNLSKAYYRLGQKSNGDTFRKLAKESSNSVSLWDTMSSFHTNRYLLDYFPTMEVFRDGEIKEDFAENWISAYLFKWNRNSYFFSLVVIVFALLISRVLLRKMIFGRYCSKCGVSMNELDAPIEKSTLCLECYHILNSRGNLDQQKLHLKEKQIRFYRNISKKLALGLNIILPGAPLIYKRSSISASLILLYHIFFISGLIFFKDWSSLVNTATLIFILSIFLIPEALFYVISFIILNKKTHIS